MKWTPTPRQEKVLSSTAKEILYGGARGGGKTDASIIWAAVPAIRDNQGRFRGLVVRDTASSLSDWVDRADKIYSMTGAKLKLSPTPHFIWPCGAKIFTGHLKDQRSLNKYLGREFQRIVIEELTQIEEEEMYIKLLGSARSTVPGLRARLLATTNPGGRGHHWVKRRFIDPIAPDTLFKERGTNITRVFYPSTIEDNPHLMNADPEYVEYLDSLPGKIKEAWRNGNWDILEGAYFTEFNRKKNVIKPFSIPSSWATYRAIDWGYYPDPAVCLWFAVSPNERRKRIVLFRERHWTRTLPNQVAEDILYISKDDSQQRWTIADPSMWAGKNGISDAEEMAKGGLGIIPADNTRIPGWTRVHGLLKNTVPIRGNDGKIIRTVPQLEIFDTCVNTIKSITLAQHGDKDPMDVGDFKLDHWLDSLRYFSMGRSGHGNAKKREIDPLSIKGIRGRKAVDLRRSGII